MATLPTSIVWCSSPMPIKAIGPSHRNRRRSCASFLEVLPMSPVRLVTCRCVWVLRAVLGSVSSSPNLRSPPLPKGDARSLLPTAYLSRSAPDRRPFFVDGPGAACWAGSRAYARGLCGASSGVPVSAPFIGFAQAFPCVLVFFWGDASLVERRGADSWLSAYSCNHLGV